MCTRLEFPYTHILDENNELVDIESLGPDAGEDMSYNFDKLFLWGFIIQCLPVCGALVMILGLALKWNWLLLIGSVIYMPVAPGILGWVFTGFCMRWNNAGHVASGDDYWPLVHAKDAALTATEETLKLRDYDTPEEMYEEEAVRAEALTVAELALEGYPSDYDHYLMTAYGTFLNAYLTFMIFFMIANLIALILGIFLCKNTCWSTLKRMSPYQKPMLLPA
jgi:tetrahydromethanopterin S-methyltransferase subunit B